jgi:hypothetical protein
VQVITSVTYRTHPEASHIQVVAVQINATTNASLRPVLEGSIGALVNMTDAGYTGYGLVSKGFSGLFIRPGGTVSDMDTGLAGFRALDRLEGASFGVFNFTFPTWLDYGAIFLGDPNIAQNVMDASRLLTTEMALNKADQIVDMIFEYGPENYPAFNFSKSPRTQSLFDGVSVA